jgi:hypothetical protein
MPVASPYAVGGRFLPWRSARNSVSPRASSLAGESGVERAGSPASHSAILVVAAIGRVRSCDIHHIECRTGLSVWIPARELIQPKPMLFLKKRNRQKSDARTEIVAANLSGHGRRETCLVYARYADVTDPSVSPGYRDFRVRDLPGDLEAGDYQLEVGGVTVTLRIDDGQWTIVDRELPIMRNVPCQAG